MVFSNVIYRPRGRINISLNCWQERSLKGQSLSGEEWPTIANHDIKQVLVNFSSDAKVFLDQPSGFRPALEPQNVRHTPRRLRLLRANRTGIHSRLR